MATTRRDRNKNFFKWEPVEDGNNRFTPNAPLNWFYEIIETTESFSSEEEESVPDLGARSDRDEELTAREILRMTPPNEELLKTARMYPPSPKWFENDEEKPF